MRTTIILLSLLSLIVSFIFLLRSAKTNYDETQVVMQSLEDLWLKASSATITTPRIAIIGARITGASSAHHLHQLNRLRQPLDITVFEADDQVGGRIRSAYVHNEPDLDVEVGAATFADDDWCLEHAMQEVGLKPILPSRSTHQTAIWNGNEVRVTYKERRYGLSLPKI